jgi:hypothetical protein
VLKLECMRESASLPLLSLRYVALSTDLNRANLVPRLYLGSSMSYTDFYEVAPWHDTSTDKDQSGGFMACRSVEIEPISLYVPTVALDN